MALAQPGIRTFWPWASSASCKALCQWPTTANYSLEKWAIHVSNWSSVAIKKRFCVWLRSENEAFQEDSTLILTTSPEKDSKDSRCPYALNDPKGYRKYISPIFKEKTCAEANKEANEWAEKVLRGKNSEGKDLAQLGGNDCSNYTKQLFEIKGTSDRCESRVVFEVQVGPLRESLRFKIGAKANRKWSCAKTN